MFDPHPSTASPAPSSPSSGPGWTLPVFAGVAPMEGVTNLPMRLWMSLASAPESLATPFLRVTATYPHKALPRPYAPELSELKGAVPYQLIPQLMAADGEEFLKAAELVLPVAPFVDLNCGCPSPTCTGKGAGSSLLRDADEFAALAAGLSRRLGAERLSLKIRTGYASDAEFPHLLAGVAGLPLARLTVHGRTRPAGYKGEARWDLIGLAAERAAAPVVASGDVVDAASLAARLGAAPRARGVIVGRGVLRNPWIFTELRTGAPVSLSLPVLRRALASFGILHELYAERFDDLIRLVATGLIRSACGGDAAAWQNVYAQAAQVLYGRVPDPDRALGGELPLSRHSLGRVKMVWNYLRSSLPAPYFAPLLMRSGDAGTLLDGIAQIHADAGSQSGAAPLLPLKHNPALDWLYSGGKSEGTACAPTTPSRS